MDKAQKWQVEQAHSLIIAKILDAGKYPLAISPIKSLKQRILMGCKEPTSQLPPKSIANPGKKLKSTETLRKLEAEKLEVELDAQFPLHLVSHHNATALILDCQHHIARVLIAQGHWSSLRALTDGGIVNLETWLTNVMKNDTSNAQKAGVKFSRTFFDAAAKMELNPKVSLWLRAASFACLSKTETCTQDKLLEQVLKAGVQFEKASCSALAESCSVRTLADFYARMEVVLRLRDQDSNKVALWYDHLAFVCRKWGQEGAEDALLKCLFHSRDTLVVASLYIQMIALGRREWFDKLKKLDIVWNKDCIARFCKSCDLIKKCDDLELLKFVLQLCRQGLFTENAKLIQSTVDLCICVAKLLVGEGSLECHVEALTLLNEALGLVKGGDAIVWLSNAFYVAGASACKIPDEMGINAMELSCGLMEQVGGDVFETLSSRFEGLAGFCFEFGKVEKGVETVRKCLLAAFKVMPSMGKVGDGEFVKARIVSVLSRAFRWFVKLDVRESLLLPLLDDDFSLLELELGVLRNVSGSVFIQRSVVAALLDKIGTVKWNLELIRLDREIHGIEYSSTAKTLLEPLVSQDDVWALMLLGMMKNECDEFDSSLFEQAIKAWSLVPSRISCTPGKIQKTEVDYFVMAEYLSAIGQTRLLVSCLKVALGHGHRLRGLTLLADTYLAMGYTSLANEAHLEAEKMGQLGIDRGWWLLSHAHFHCSIGNVEDAKKQLAKAKAFSDGSLFFVARAFYVQASICFAQEDVTQAIFHVSTALRLIVSLSKRGVEKFVKDGKWRLITFLFECYESLGQMHLLCGLASEALFYFEQGIQLANCTHAQQALVRFSLFVAEVEYRRLLLDASAENLDKASALQRSIHAQEDCKDDVFLHLRRGDWHLRRETFLEACKSYEMAGRVVDFISDDDFIRQMSRLEVDAPRRSVGVCRRSLTGLSMWANNQSGDVDVHLLDYLKTDALSRLAVTFCKHGHLAQAEAVLKTKEPEQMEHLAALGMVKLYKIRDAIQSQSLSLNSLDSIFASVMQHSVTRLDLQEDIDGAQSLLGQAYDACLAYGNYTLLRDVSRGLAQLSTCRMHLNLVQQDEWQDCVYDAAFFLDLSKGITAHRELLACSINRLQQDLTWPKKQPEEKDARWKLICELHRQDHDSGFIKDFCAMLPQNWTVSSLTADLDRGDLYITRFRKTQPPLVVRLPIKRQVQREVLETGLTFAEALQEFNEIIQQSNATLHNGQAYDTKEAKTQWWQTRKTLDKQLGDLLENMESVWLGGFKKLLDGTIPCNVDWCDLDHPEAKSVYHLKTKLEPLIFDQISHKNKLGRASTKSSPEKGQRQTPLELDPVLCQVLIRLGADPSDSELEDVMYYLFESYESAGMIVEYDELDLDRLELQMKDIFATCHAMLNHEGCVDMIGPVDEDTFTILVLDKDLQSFPWESLPTLRGQSISRCPSLTFVRDRIAQSKLWMSNNLVEAVTDANQEDFLARYAILQSKASYVLNPSQDLVNTQKEFEALVQKPEWKGCIARLPTQEEMTAWLGASDVFCYFGHGGGEQYLRPKELKKLDRCAVALLMGCSSARLFEQGEFEPRGNALNYLIAGCPAVVGNLWDVTDKDIDRFSKQMLQEWGLSTETQPSAEAAWIWCGKALSTAVATSRDVCTLKYLNGSSPVVYGIPEVYVAALTKESQDASKEATAKPVQKTKTNTQRKR
jgi:separase